MTPPKFTKPFNAAHAQAGAPYGCDSGSAAEIFKWDGRDGILIGVRSTGCADLPEHWKTDGRNEQGEDHLVMLPLGEISGKPVFVGDELVTPGGNAWIVEPKHRGFAHLKWPAKAKAYPISSASPDALQAAFMRHIKRGETMNEATLHMANAAIRHAIDAGQVMLPSDARPEAFVGIVINGDTIYGSQRAIDYVSKCLLKEDPYHSATRDKAIAHAVLEAAQRSAEIYSTGCAAYLRGVDINAAIAKVPL